MKTLLITTAQISKSIMMRQAGWATMDVSIKSGYREFAPTWEMVMGYKQGKISEEKYTEMYYSLMRASYKDKVHHDTWLDFITLERVCLLCYCPEGAFCHRHLLAEMIKKVAESQGYDVQIIPESKGLEAAKEEAKIVASRETAKKIKEWEESRKTAPSPYLPGITAATACKRCGGDGIWKGDSLYGRRSGVCFRCGGSGKEPRD